MKNDEFPREKQQERKGLSRWDRLTPEQRERWKSNTRNSEYLRRYGISTEEYEELLKQQYGCCAICSLHISAFKTRLAVDHDHNTGKVRGLLCTTCNVKLGIIEDAAFSKKAASYLKNPPMVTLYVTTNEKTILEKQREQVGRRPNVDVDNERISNPNITITNVSKHNTKKKVESRPSIRFTEQGGTSHRGTRRNVDKRKTLKRNRREK